MLSGSTLLRHLAQFYCAIYTSCPLLVREGSAMLIEFDYDGNLIPSLPMIEPLKDSYLAWLLKYALLKPAYVATLKGNV